MKAIKESELSQMGLVIDPADPNKAIRIGDGRDVPDDTWELERLTQYALESLARADRMQVVARGYHRAATTRLYRAGHALCLLRERLKDNGAWCRWQKDHNIPRTNAWEAIQLYERAESEESLRELTLAEAKQRHGITKPLPVEKARNPLPCDKQPAEEEDGVVLLAGAIGKEPPRNGVLRTSSRRPRRAKEGMMNNSKAYLTVGWGIDDIRKHRPEWTEEQCRAFLCEHGQSIADAMAETGWEIIEGVLAVAEQEAMASWRIADVEGVEA